MYFQGLSHTRYVLACVVRRLTLLCVLFAGRLLVQCGLLELHRTLTGTCCVNLNPLG
jgi:hypothetical protein